MKRLPTNVELRVLEALPNCGYSVWLHLGWSNHGAVYELLKRMVRNGFAEVAGYEVTRTKPRKIYRPTAKAQQVLDLYRSFGDTNSPLRPSSP